MAYKQHFFVQFYELNRRGKLVPGQSCECDDADHARRRAQNATVKVRGAVAFSQMINSDSGDAEEPVLIAAFGQVPKEVGEMAA